MLTTLSLDVYCRTTHESNLVYRIYVDQDLLTERTWIWPAYETYINEYIEVNLNPGTHRVQLVNPGGNITFKTVALNNNIVSKNTQLQEFAFVI
jgi:hypothetical protein